jgi:hypothetical protein
MERVESMISLDDWWDRSGARAVTFEAFERALQVLSDTMSDDSVAPHFVPVGDGGIQLEWHCAGVDLEVYIEPDGRVSAWCREGSREWEEDYYPQARLAKELSLLTYEFCE